MLFATVCWAFGVFISPRLTLPDDNFVGAVYEMLGGGAVLLVAGALVGEFADFSVSAVPAEGWWAFTYLTLIGSVVAFSAFVWLLGHAPPSLVTTYAYVNPVVAVFLGWLILSEPVTLPVVVGGSLAVFGVSLVVRGERPLARTVVYVLGSGVASEGLPNERGVVNPFGQRVGNHPTQTAPGPALHPEGEGMVVGYAVARWNGRHVGLVASENGERPLQALRNVRTGEQLRRNAVDIVAGGNDVPSQVAQVSRFEKHPSPLMLQAEAQVLIVLVVLGRVGE